MKKRATPRQQDLQTLINNLLAATASLQNATTTLANAQAGFNAALNAYDSGRQPAADHRRGQCPALGSRCPVSSRGRLQQRPDSFPVRMASACALPGRIIEDHQMDMLNHRFADRVHSPVRMLDRCLDG